jgi:hypothetical protein
VQGLEENMKANVWRTVDDEGEVVSVTLIPDTHTPEQRDAILQEGRHIKLRTIEGRTWDDCMAKHHELMGWAPYVPMEPYINPVLKVVVQGVGLMLIATGLVCLWGACLAIGAIEAIGRATGAIDKNGA